MLFPHMRLFQTLPFDEQDIAINHYVLDSVDLSAWPTDFDIDIGLALGDGEMEAALIAHNVAASCGELLVNFELVFR